MTALEDLWYGNINPHETFLNGNCRFKYLLSLMGKNRDKLSDTLTEQQKEILAKYEYGGEVEHLGRCELNTSVAVN